MEESDVEGFNNFLERNWGKKTAMLGMYMRDDVVPVNVDVVGADSISARTPKKRGRKPKTEI